MFPDLITSLAFLAAFVGGTFVGHCYAVGSRRLDDLIVEVEDEAEDPDTIPWRRH